ncbi:VOC family protein [Flavihumibacter fluvii]|uniref:VOC family protein n=1 Tax=Flavihumibacter fluvii TaxID=2838157 RepID=UPI001BDEC9EF|nr:VOC family protein [Flavihumibacter fluvii]ULQ53421.1 VOC family protein [Flavihumibacter fluvii]
MVKINKLQHVGIPVTDMKVSESFYTRLGFKNVMQSDFLLEGDKGVCVMMQNGEVLIELYQLPDKFLPEVAARNNGHVDHIAFDVHEIDRVYEKLLDEGYTIMEDAPVLLPFWKNGCKYFNIVGPDGERLEFNEIL